MKPRKDTDVTDVTDVTNTLDTRQPIQTVGFHIGAEELSKHGTRVDCVA